MDLVSEESGEVTFVFQTVCCLAPSDQNMWVGND